MGRRCAGVLKDLLGFGKRMSSLVFQASGSLSQPATRAFANCWYRGWTTSRAQNFQSIDGALHFKRRQLLLW